MLSRMAVSPNFTTLSGVLNMKILHVYRSVPNNTTKKLVEVVSKDNESVNFDLNIDNPDYHKLVDMIFDADKTICWW